jgi:8-oxo-dGTP pyrophosphatase MutT (NUDIX family)
MFQQSPIPSHAHKAYQWHAIDVRNREQELFDWSFATFEAIQRSEFSQIIPITQDKRIIIVEEEQPRVGIFYGLIGGTIEKWDDPLYTIHKEAREETGMQIHHIQEIYQVPLYGSRGKAYGYITHDFSFPYAKTPEPWEKIQTKEVSFDEFIDLLTHDRRRSIECSRRIIKNYLLKNNKQWLYNLFFSWITNNSPTP